MTWVEVVIVVMIMSWSFGIVTWLIWSYHKDKEVK